MQEEAKAVIERAITVADHEPHVDECLGEIAKRAEGESTKMGEVLDKAGKKRTFLVAVGQSLRAATGDLDGAWKFPFGEIKLMRSGSKLTGFAEIKGEPSGFGVLFGEKTVRVERYTFAGELQGRLCKFTLKVEEPATHVSLRGLLGGSGKSTKEGFIVFAADSRSGSYVESGSDELANMTKITKVA